jgi:hypothetical protein
VIPRKVIATPQEVFRDVKNTININWFCFVLQPLMNHWCGKKLLKNKMFTSGRKL